MNVWKKEGGTSIDRGSIFKSSGVSLSTDKSRRYLSLDNFSFELKILKLSSKLIKINLNKENSFKNKLGINFNPLSKSLIRILIYLLDVKNGYKLPIWNVLSPTL